jgi:hypothetical protein
MAMSKDVKRFWIFHQLPCHNAAAKFVADFVGFMPQLEASVALPVSCRLWHP